MVYNVAQGLKKMYWYYRVTWAAANLKFLLLRVEVP